MYGYGLDVGEDGGLVFLFFLLLCGGFGGGFFAGFLCGFGFGFGAVELFDEPAAEGFVAYGSVVRGSVGELGGEGAEGGVVDDLFDGGDVVGLLEVSAATGVAGLSPGRSLVGREGEGGDLEAVEEQAGAARVEVVGGDVGEDLAEGGLDGAAVLDQRHLEGGLAGAAGFEAGDRVAGGVVEVAEGFVFGFAASGGFEAGAFAAVAVG